MLKGFGDSVNSGNSQHGYSQPVIFVPLFSHQARLCWGI